jgi:hypothetical protein
VRIGPDAAIVGADVSEDTELAGVRLSLSVQRSAVR